MEVKMANPSKQMYPVNVEVRMSSAASTNYNSIREHVRTYIQQSEDELCLPSILQGWEEIPALAGKVEQIAVSELPVFLGSSLAADQRINVEQAVLHVHVYQCSEQEEHEEYASKGDDGEDVLAATDRDLPSSLWEGLWESLIYPDDVKLRLLDYIYATIMLSDAGVDFNIVSWNRVVLLHGPPGTGKTSLCRALAQKLSIRLMSKYNAARLLEINSHSLFSRWFSESGKLVQRLFGHVTEMADNEDNFVIVLIDEIESLTAARASAMAGNEPSDALRVVNALLTQLDKLKHRKNVLVMATSNLVSAIDTAFIDRADIVEYIGLPPQKAVYGIVRSCLLELMSKGVVDKEDIPDAQTAEYLHDILGDGDRGKMVASRLLNLANLCQTLQMSGRSLRRLPVLAHARCMGYMPSLLLRAQAIHSSAGRSRATTQAASTSPQASGVAGSPQGIPVEVWLDAMEKVVDERAQQVGFVSHGGEGVVKAE